MEPVGKKKLAAKAAERLGETVEGAAVVGDFTNYGVQMAKAMVVPKPQKMLNLIVTADHVRLFDASIRDEFKTEVFSHSCNEITRIERRSGTTGQRIRITFADDEKLEFRAIKGLTGGRAVVELISQKASVPIEPL